MRRTTSTPSTRIQRATYRRHAEELTWRGIYRPIPRLPKIALIDALIATGLGHEFDWLDFSDDARCYWKKLGEVLGVPLKVPPESDAIDALLRHLDKAFKPHGYSLVRFDIQSDSIPVVALNSELAKQFSKLARTAGVRACVSEAL